MMKHSGIPDPAPGILIIICGPPMFCEDMETIVSKAGYIKNEMYVVL